MTSLAEAEAEVSDRASAESASAERASLSAARPYWRGDTFTSQHQGPYTVSSISSKGVATIVKGSACQRVNVSRLRTYYRIKSKSV